MSHEGSDEAVGSTIPVDLLAVVFLAAGVVFLTVTSGPTTSPVRILLGIVFVVFAPGYTLVSLLLPASTIDPAEVTVDSRGDGPPAVRTVERVVLSIGSSVILVPLVGVLLNYSPWGLRPTPMVVSIGAVTVVLSALAAARRWRLPPERRYRILLLEGLARERNRLVVFGSRLEIALSVVLVVGLLAALTGVGLALVTVDNGERYTEFYLLGEDPESGELVAGEYPTELERGEEAELVVGITNQEREPTTYTVVVLFERMAGEPGNKTVVERTEYARFERTLEHGETWEERHTIEPTIGGDRIRVTYLLYADSPPADPSADNAYRNLHIWIDISDRDR